MEAAQPVLRVRPSPDTAWVVAVWVGTVVYAMLLSVESIADHDAFATSFDVAHYDQLLWRLANGENPFSTVVSRPLLADHFQPGLVLLTPLYWLGLGVPGILAVQSIALGATAPALFALARAAGARPGLAALPAFLWLVCPWVAAVNLFDFHPLALSAPLVVLSVLAVFQERPVLLLVTAVLAMSLKEDIALTYVMLGFVLVLHGTRRLGGLLALGSALWFAVAYVAVSMSGGSNDAYGRRFAGERGDSVVDAVRWMAVHPVETVSDVVGQSLGAVVLLIASTASLGLLAPSWLLLSVPTAAHNALSAYEYQHDFGSHYHLGTLIGSFVAAAVGTARLDALGRQGRIAWLPLGTIAAGVAVLGAVWVHDPGNERTRGSRDEAAIRRGLALVPGDAAVAATSTLLPQLSQRTDVYSLPEPFIPVEWGSALTPSELARRAERVEFVAYRDGDILPWPYAGGIAELRRILGERGFVELEDAGPVHVLERRR